MFCSCAFVATAVVSDSAVISSAILFSSAVTVRFTSYPTDVVVESILRVPFFNHVLTLQFAADKPVHCASSMASSTSSSSASPMASPDNATSPVFFTLTWTLTSISSFWSSGNSSSIAASRFFSISVTLAAVPFSSSRMSFDTSTSRVRTGSRGAIVGGGVVGEGGMVGLVGGKVRVITTSLSSISSSSPKPLSSPVDVSIGITSEQLAPLYPPEHSHVASFSTILQSPWAEHVLPAESVGQFIFSQVLPVYRGAVAPAVQVHVFVSAAQVPFPEQ
mmetsp:Transcript_12495/g.22637  ORF Transcript_12495/g.22637 Transcript_12495/m.22637 type:complete len:276 (+) Transcript_12495:825-1652(+)